MFQLIKNYECDILITQRSVKYRHLTKAFASLAYSNLCREIPRVYGITNMNLYLISMTGQQPVKAWARFALMQTAFNLIQWETLKAFHLLPEQSHLCRGKTECAVAH